MGRVIRYPLSQCESEESQWVNEKSISPHNWEGIGCQQSIASRVMRRKDVKTTMLTSLSCGEKSLTRKEIFHMRECSPMTREFSTSGRLLTQWSADSLSIPQKDHPIIFIIALAAF